MKDLKEILYASPLGWKILFWVCFLLSSALIVISFILPPKGAIDPSVLQAVGELMAFPTLYSATICILKGIGVKYQRGNTTIEVQGKEHKTEQ